MRFGLGQFTLQIPAWDTRTHAELYADTLELAGWAEDAGFESFWLAEHHSIEGLACSATPVLMGHVAGATKSIRVGSGGVMLPNHAPLVVAEQFGTLEALFPGRIDLGLGRAPGSEPAANQALRAFDGEQFPAHLSEMLALSSGAHVPEERFVRIARNTRAVEQQMTQIVLRPGMIFGGGA